MHLFKNYIWNTPSARLAFILAFGLASVVCAIQIALQEPKFDFVFKPGVSIEAIRLTPLDFIAEPGELQDYENINLFFSRQNQLTTLISKRSITISKNGETISIQARNKSIGDLSALFWIQALGGLGSLIISGWIWALRSRDVAARFFALSGFFTFILALSAGIYTTRDLALPSTLFKNLWAANAWGSTFFSVSMVSLFLVYPTKLPRWCEISFFQAFICNAWTSLFFLQWMPEWANLNRMFVIIILVICVNIFCQFARTKNTPRARASLLWLGIAVLLGAGAFVVFNTIPVIMGLNPLHQAYSLIFLFVIYLGLAAGLTQFRLFDVGTWAFSFLFYGIGALIFVLLDAGLIYFLGLDQFPALGLALLVTGFFYLPLRDFLWQRFVSRDSLQPYELLTESLHVAFAPSSSLRSSRWEILLRKLFNPLEIEKIDSAIREVEMSDDHLSLTVPAVADAPPLKLIYPGAGRILFSSQSLELARQLVSFITQAESNREAYDRGVLEERQRVAQDLHDDLGARLLSGLQLADENLRPTFEAAIADMRAIISETSSDENIPLSYLIADLRHEIHRRLSTTNILLEWPMLELPDKPITYYHYKTLRSALREIVSNTIRHSHASKLKVEFEIHTQFICVTAQDNGKGLPKNILEGNYPKYGLKNLHKRITNLKGYLHLYSSERGSTIRIELPVSESIFR